MWDLARNWAAGFCFVLGLCLAGGENDDFIYNLIGLVILFIGIGLIWRRE